MRFYGTMLPAVSGGQVSGRARMIYVSSSAFICAAALAAMLVLAPASWSSLMQKGGGAARQQELSDVLTAPIEKVARSLGDSLAQAVRAGKSLTLLEQNEEDVPTFKGVQPSTAVATCADYKRLVECGVFLKYMQEGGQTMYLPPSAQSELSCLQELPLAPVQAPASLGKPFGVRFRYFVGNGNDIVFNGGTEDTIHFINHFFGYDIKTTPVKHRFHRRAHAFRHTIPVNHQAFLSLMPQELPNYDGITAVDMDSLPKGEAVAIFDDVPPGHSYDEWHFEDGNEVASPAFRLRYCEAADNVGDLNRGLPMKIHPADCGRIMDKYNMQCKCGYIFFFGWVWPKAEENIYEHTVVRLDKLASSSCPVLPPAPKVPMQKIPLPPAPKGGLGSIAGKPETGCEQYMKGVPDYDAPAQNWYYDKPDGTRMVRHWCKSAYGPQEEWYRYQRYVPRTKNNLPPPPINDFDFLNSFGRDYYKESRARARHDSNAGTFDDYTLGNYGALAAARAWGVKQAAFDDFHLGMAHAGVPDDSKIDAYNMGKMTCVGSDCFDGTHHAGRHSDGGMQPYDDYAHMDGDDNSVAARGGAVTLSGGGQRGRRRLTLAERMGVSQEEEHVEEEHARGLTVLDPRLDPDSLARAPTGASDDSA